MPVASESAIVGGDAHRKVKPAVASSWKREAARLDKLARAGGLHMQVLAADGHWVDVALGRVRTLKGIAGMYAWHVRNRKVKAFRLVRLDYQNFGALPAGWPEVLHNMK
jgi:hypothetical protein